MGNIAENKDKDEKNKSTNNILRINSNDEKNDILNNCPSKDELFLCDKSNKNYAENLQNYRGSFILTKIDSLGPDDTVYNKLNGGNNLSTNAFY